MKKFITATLMLASMNVFSQSYLILNNGITLTTDNAGFVYDFGNFRLPYKVQTNGGQFLVSDKKLTTVDSSGFMYEKSLKVEKIKGKGLNYLITDDNQLITIDSKGFYYKFDKEVKLFKKVQNFGGNFFTVKSDAKKIGLDLYTLNDKGNYFKIAVDGLAPADITILGGTFFQTKTGATYTVSKDGFVYPKTDLIVGEIKKIGGNFFIDSNNLIFTVSETGLLIIPKLPVNMKIANLQKLGANYLIDSEGRIFIVDKNGVISERTISHDLRNTKVLSI